MNYIAITLHYIIRHFFLLLAAIAILADKDPTIGFVLIGIAFYWKLDDIYGEVSEGRQINIGISMPDKGADENKPTITVGGA